VELLRVLGDSFGAALDSQRLRNQRLAQEQREKELVSNAAQSELKALRAQINPHFLFNALNTIAALIPHKPDRAEQTVEQLAEVFRYTVRRSDREWVRLTEEIDFVRAYMDIERARFGERLQVHIALEKAAENVKIPAMIVQTLAENAIKHGIAAVRGVGVITISVCSRGAKVIVRVEDNGPGFETGVVFESLPESASGRYGLRNVQARLHAYFGDEAHLRFERDAAAGTTSVSFEIPMAVDVRMGA
jgi:LytS/YehU family sensor histidine kinase